MIKAKDFVGGFANIYAIPYKGEILYNILLEEHSKMIINNLIVETMDPKNRLAKIYNTFHFDKLGYEDQITVIEQLNKIVLTQNNRKCNKSTN